MGCSTRRCRRGAQQRQTQPDTVSLFANIVVGGGFESRSAPELMSCGAETLRASRPSAATGERCVAITADGAALYSVLRRGRRCWASAAYRVMATIVTRRGPDAANYRRSVCRGRDGYPGLQRLMIDDAAVTVSILRLDEERTEGERGRKTRVGGIYVRIVMITTQAKI